MKPEVLRAIQRGIQLRRRVLTALSYGQRQELLEQLFLDFFARQHILLQKWAALTGQSAQVDTGYIAQFVASIVLGEPGQGFRGKGDDLADGSEVKSAANISGVDRPRWNHNLGTMAEDESKRDAGAPTKWEQYLASPYVFYLLADRTVTSNAAASTSIRVRAWCLDAQADEDWRDLILRFVHGRSAKQYNLQLHPPVGYDDHIVVNTIGNLDFSEVFLFDARIDLSDPGAPGITWVTPLPSDVFGAIGRTKSMPYIGSKDRPSRLTGVEDLVADLSILPRLFPTILAPVEAEELWATTAVESRTMQEAND